MHGEVLVGGERLAFDGLGQRDHSWGVRDWWTVAWTWTAGWLEDGTRYHGTHVRLGDDRAVPPGLRAAAGGPLTGVDHGLAPGARAAACRHPTPRWRSASCAWT